MKPQRIEITSIGVDLDNTLIDYSLAYKAIAAKRNVQVDVLDREHIRNALRRGSEDEEWQAFQSHLYTDGLSYAQLADGAEEFLTVCQTLDVRVFIVSHKTARGPRRFGSRDLRQPAVSWLESQGMEAMGVQKSDVFFEDSQEAKVDKIRNLTPDVFIDDLESVLSHPLWPRNTLPIRYASGSWHYMSGRWQAGFPAISDWVHRRGDA